MARDGTFDTSCATNPYDVALPWAGVLYQGLTRGDPVVTVPSLLACDEVVPVSGIVEGRTEGLPAVVVVATPSSTFGSSWVLEDASWSGGACLREGAKRSATVRALEWTETSSGTDSFTGYGEATIPLLQGDGNTASPVLRPVPNGRIEISTDAADPRTLGLHLWARWPEGGTSKIGSTGNGTANGVLPTPLLPGVTFTAVVQVGGEPMQAAWRSGLAGSAAPEPIALPRAPVFTAPPAGATVDGTTDFVFEGIDDAVYGIASPVTACPRASRFLRRSR